VPDFVQLPLRQAHPLQPPAGLRELQARGPVHKARTAVGDEAWLVTAYQDVHDLLADPRLGRSHPHTEDAARTGKSAMFGGPTPNYETEHADHARTRTLMQPHFAPKRIRALKPRVEELTAGLLDDLARRDPPADLNEALAQPLPILVICELLGVPYEDRADFRGWIEDVTDTTDGERSRKGFYSLFGYAKQLVTRKRARPGADFISRLCATDGVRDSEIATLAMGLLFSGHETTGAAIGMGALLLLTHPEQCQALREDPRRIPAAVEEILRVPGRGGIGIPRYAREDLQIGGVKVRAGDLVLIDLGAANHDESVFPDSDRFDITRQADAHLTFGHGMRYCIGAPLARLELQVALGQLISRFPQMRLAVPTEQIALSPRLLSRGPAALPVTW
jgi:cytochrome P450